MPDLPSASLLENVQFNQSVILPNALQGLFRRRRTPVGVATRVNVDGQAVRLIGGLRRKHGPGPVWVRVMNQRALLLLEVDDVRRVLEGAPHPFAADPPAKRTGMGHFQPHALTLSRGDLWRERRRFTEEVLDSAHAAHRKLGDHIVAVAAEETAALIEELDTDLGYEELHQAFRRIVRRVVLGDAARDDEAISELLGDLMSEANGLPSDPSEHYEPFMAAIRAYLAKADPQSLIGLATKTPASPDVRVDGQIAHWLFAMQDTLSANVLRALVLLATHPEQRDAVRAELDAVDKLESLAYLRACLQEAMRLWPTTPLLSRETLADITWDGAVVPAGSQILISNTFFHRDRERIDYADRFAPEAWTEGDAAENWAFNHFSHGPQGCPGSNLSLLVGSAVIGTLLDQCELAPASPRLDPAKPLPHMLDVFGARVALQVLVPVAA